MREWLDFKSVNRWYAIDVYLKAFNENYSTNREPKARRVVYSISSAEDGYQKFGTYADVSIFKSSKTNPWVAYTATGTAVFRDVKYPPEFE